VNHSWVKNNNPLVHIIHGYDYSGNRTKRYDAVHAANSELYTYDQLGQIKSLDRGELNAAQTSVANVVHSESWNFDKTGNWVQYTKNSTVENRTHNAANELQGIATHDANGNMVLMPSLKGKYDAWNRLVEVKDSNDNLIASYEYNGLNQRIKKTVGSTVTKSFFNENWQELESVTNSQVTSYIWGLCYIDDLVLREKSEERLYSLADSNWNVISICNESGTIQERYTYDVFGKRNVYDVNFSAKTASDFNWNRAFTGQVFDNETGLMLYRNRFYHTELGRFVNRDPIGYDAGDVNLFRMVFNKILISLDPKGLQATWDMYPQMPTQEDCYFQMGKQICKPKPSIPPSTNSCNGYDVSIGSTCKDNCSKIIVDSYPAKAKSICEKFIIQYKGSNSVNCVANCLAANEKSMLSEFSCDDRNNKRLQMHCVCYAKCGFVPTSGLPSGGIHVGAGMLLPSACRVGVRETGRCASEGCGPKW
jgi:RHS repeat-associated protein